MMRLFTAAALAAALATPAAAQQAGTYSGTSLDGNGVQFVVGTDAGTGKLAVTSASVSFTGICTGGGSILQSGWGFGLLQDIKNAKVAYVAASPYFTIGFNLVFSADGQSATGNIHTWAPTLTPVGTDPEKALFCTSKSQTMGLNFVPGSAKVNPPAHGAVWLGSANAGKN